MRPCKVGGVTQRSKELYKAHRGMIEAAEELDCSNACIRLREPVKSEDKAKGGTFVESPIPWSHRSRALVVKGVEEVENVEANSKY
ncbi:hypothetical protein B296_00032837 [Ensete ventricosum]|uniref:Uncharacterized protein n=1 Tax=Ensete ventricosum TaxID=4639 RepID=A0A426ZFW5_ENSVE|nr:hypothetical protein B296_00032837 [Ensete ventricosum]